MTRHIYVVCFFMMVTSAHSFAQAQLRVDVASKPHSVSDDGLSQDERGRILLAIPKGKIDDGNRSANRSTIRKQMLNLRLDGMENLYLMSDDVELVAHVVVRDKDLSRSVIVQLIGPLLKVVSVSDVRQLTISAYHGEKWVVADPTAPSESFAGKVKRKKYGELLAYSRTRLTLDDLQKPKGQNPENAEKVPKAENVPRAKK